MKIKGIILFFAFLVCGNIYAQTFTPVEGMYIGPDFIVWEAEATKSPLGLWQIVREGDSRYFKGSTIPPIGGTHMEFTGNNPSVGNPNSPLVYEFVAPKTGKYRLGARMYQRLEGLEADKCNDVYIKMEGNFTSGNNISTADLKTNQKFYGRGTNNWGVLSTLELAGHVQNSAVYNLIGGETYKLTVSGRAQRTNIDYWLLYEMSIPIVISSFPQKDLAYENPPKYRPGVHYDCKVVRAIDMEYKNISGFTDAQLDYKNNLDILQVVERDAWAAARFIYDGTNGEVKLTLNTMQKIDGESSYRVKIGNILAGEVKNTRIFGSTIPDYTVEKHQVNENPVAISEGDTIQIEFNNTTNGLVPEDNLTATSRGRWVSIEVCTTGSFKVYKLKFSKNQFNVTLNNTLTLDMDKVLPPNADTDLVWLSRNTSVVEVNNGVVKGLKAGSTTVVVSTKDQLYKDSCEVSVILPVPFHGTPLKVPGTRIEAEDYDIGGQGVAYNDIDANNNGGQYRINEGVDVQTCGEGGFNVGWISKGEWLNYTIEVQEDADYAFKLRVASANDPIKFHLQIDGVNVSGHQIFTSTNAWQSYKTVSVERIPLKKGVQVFTVYVDEGNSSWNLNWIEIEKMAPLIAVEGVNIHEDSITISHLDIVNLNFSILPVNAANQTVVWSSSNSAVATVNSYGQVSGKTVGEAIIYARTSDAGFIDSCLVMVYQKVIDVSGVSLTGCSPDSLLAGMSVQLFALVSPDNADDKSIVWSSSDTTVAIVQSNGLVVALAPGHTDIKATTNSGEHNATCKVYIGLNTGSVDIDNVKKNSSLIKAYPNPASKTLFVEVPLDFVMCKMRIYNLDGQLLHETKLTGTLNQVDVEQFFPQGIILVQIINNKKSFLHKVVLK